MCVAVQGICKLHLSFGCAGKGLALSALSASTAPSPEPQEGVAMDAFPRHGWVFFFVDFMPWLLKALCKERIL